MQVEESIPQFTNHVDFCSDSEILRLHGDGWRHIIAHGRRGLHTQRIHSRFALSRHCMNQDSGSLTLWVMPMTDLAPAQSLEQHRISNPHSDRVVFLTDREAVQDTNAAAFSMFFERYWHPVFMAKWVTGDAFGMQWSMAPGAIAMANHFEFERHQWYCLGLSWDRERAQYRIYVNGVLIAAENQYPHANYRSELCGPELYGGSPSLAYSSLTFFSEVLDGNMFKELYRKEHSPDLSQGSVDTRIGSIYEGKGVKEAKWELQGEWIERLSLGLTDSSEYSRFINQGCATAVKFTDEGMHVTTPNFERYFETRQNAGHRETDMARMYLWTREIFEGDLHVSLEFKLRDHGGLALLIFQAAGMNGEDFLEDYPIRTNGAMRCVCWEDICNYHWEFYRETVDTRNDLVSHAMLKNPWFRPMAFQIENRQWECDRWYRLEYLQEGNRLRGAIDGNQVIDVTDCPHDNNGPVHLQGRLAIRCMMRTNMLFRNLKVRTRPAFKVEELS